MKHKRRQELRTNELNQFLFETVGFFKRNGNYLLGGLAVLAVLLVGIRYFQNQSASALQQGYSELHALTYETDEDTRASLDKLKELSSRIQEAAFVLDTLDSRAAAASSRMTDPATGEVKPAFAEAARDAYESIVRQFPQNALAVGSALSGLAIVEETLFIADHDLSHKGKAKDYLQRIVDDARLRSTPIAMLAVERLNGLDEVFQVITFAAAPVVTGPPPPSENPPSLDSSMENRPGEEKSKPKEPPPATIPESPNSADPSAGSSGDDEGGASGDDESSSP